MRMFKDYSTHIRSTRKEIVLEYLLSIVAEFVILACCIAPFRLFRLLDVMVSEPAMMGDEMTQPTIGRLIYGIIAFVLWFVLSCIASNAAKKDRHYTSSFVGFAAGILLWQFIGEISWHYSIGGVNFVPFESITTLPMAFLFILLMIYGKKNHSFDWGIWCMLLSFAFNWMGHYITMGTYPLVEPFIDQHTWYVRVSTVVGICGFVYSIIFLLMRAKTRRGRILASMITYISIGILVFGIIEG